MFKLIFISTIKVQILDSIVVSIPACHAGDRGSIPRRGAQVLRQDFREEVG